MSKLIQLYGDSAHTEKEYPITTSAAVTHGEETVNVVLTELETTTTELETTTTELETTTTELGQKVDNLGLSVVDGAINITYNNV